MTEMTMNALALVRNAKNAVDEAQAVRPPVPDPTGSLATLDEQLAELENTLILQDITTQVDALTTAAKSLSDITDQMNRSVVQLAAVAQAVDTAATAIGALAQIVSKAASAGLV